jgi:hypothetical protein
LAESTYTTTDADGNETVCTTNKTTTNAEYQPCLKLIVIDGTPSAATQPGFVHV